MIIVTYAFLLLIIVVYPIIMTTCSFIFTEKKYNSEHEDPRNWKNKSLFKWFMSLPKAPFLSKKDWEELNGKCIEIKSLVEDLNSVPIPKGGWFGGWGFTGTHFFHIGIANEDFVNILEGLKWIEKELNEVPINVAVIERERPEQFAAALEKTKKLISFINEKGYWNYKSNYTLRGRLRKWFIQARTRVTRFVNNLWFKAFPLIKEMLWFVFYFSMLSIFSQLFCHFIDWFDPPSTGELLLAATGCMALRKGYDAVNALISRQHEVNVKQLKNIRNVTTIPPSR